MIPLRPHGVTLPISIGHSFATFSGEDDGWQRGASVIHQPQQTSVLAFDHASTRSAEETASSAHCIGRPYRRDIEHAARYAASWSSSANQLCSASAFNIAYSGGGQSGLCEHPPVLP